MNTTHVLNESPSESKRWIDGKRYWWLLSPALPLIGLGSVVAAMAGGPGALLWLLPFVFYGLVPFFDWFIGCDRVNAPESAVAQLDEDRWYSRIVYLYIPSQYILTILGAWYAVQGDLAWWELAGLVLTVGMHRSNGPILDAKASDTPELLRIVSNDHQASGSRMPCDHLVIWSDLHSRLA